MTRSSPKRWPHAALAGCACGMRTFAGPALLAARAEISGPARAAVLLAATGEVAADKSPSAPDRTAPPALAGRIAAGAYTGREIAGTAGAVAGAAAAAAGTLISFRARRLVTATTGLPDPVVAVGEDVLAYTLAAIATRTLRSTATSGPPPPQ